MQRIPIEQLVVGQQYTIRHKQRNEEAGPKTLVGFSQNGWPRFNAGHGSTSLENPAVYNFYGQKSLSNVYRNKGTEFGVRNMFKRIGMTGYNPAANLIVEKATGVKYTPNPYLNGSPVLSGGKRKTMKQRRKYRSKSRKHRHHS